MFRPHLSYRGQIALFLSPYLLGTLVLVVLPALGTVALSFTEYHAVDSPLWVGLDNFRRLAETPLVRLSLYNTLIFAAAAVPLRLLGALVLAFLLGSRRRGQRSVPRRSLPADDHARGRLCHGVALDPQPGSTGR